MGKPSRLHHDNSGIRRRAGSHLAFSLHDEQERRWSFPVALSADNVVCGSPPVHCRNHAGTRYAPRRYLGDAPAHAAPQPLPIGGLVGHRIWYRDSFLLFRHIGTALGLFCQEPRRGLRLRYGFGRIEPAVRRHIIQRRSIGAICPDGDRTYGGNHQSRAQKRSGKGLQIPHADTPAVSGHSGGTLAKPAGSGKRSRVAPEA